MWKDANVIKQNEAQKKVQLNISNMLLVFTGVADAVSTYKRRRRLKKKYSRWKKSGCVLPMPHLGKYEAIVDYVEKFAPPIFIETGTYKDDMVYSLLKQLNEIFSIDLEKAFLKMLKRNLQDMTMFTFCKAKAEKCCPEY